MGERELPSDENRDMYRMPEPQRLRREKIERIQREKQAAIDDAKLRAQSKGFIPGPSSDESQTTIPDPRPDQPHIQPRPRREDVARDSDHLSDEIAQSTHEENGAGDQA